MAPELQSGWERDQQLLERLEKIITTRLPRRLRRSQTRRLRVLRLDSWRVATHIVEAG